MRTKKKRRLRDIVVKEISCVDAPANRAPFYLAKRKTGDTRKIQKCLSKITRLLAKNMGG